MNIIKLCALVVLICLSFQQGISQSSNSEYVIQLAVYSSNETFNENSSKLRPLFKHGIVEKVTLKDGSVKAFLRNFHGNYLTKAKANQVLKSVKKEKGFQSAYVNNANKRLKYKTPTVKLVDNEVQLSYQLGTASKSIAPKVIPDEFDAKGGLYKIQLGCFSSRKTADEIVATYDLTNYEKSRINKLITHDFISLNGEVCRRYFYGPFFSRVAAEKKKAKMEKASDSDLSIITLQ